MNHYTFEEISVGMTESFEVMVTEDKQKMFTLLSGDVNPMHLDSEFAKGNGFNDKLAYGILQASFLSTLVGVYLPGEYCLFESIEALYFKKPVYIGDHLTITGTVIGKHPGGGTITLRGDIRNQNGEKVTMAKLTVGVMR